MSELELKHLAPYLPYGLKWAFDGEDIQHDVVGLDITDSGVKLLSPYNDYGSCNLKVGKPIIRPLSDLYKEINDKVGIVELAKSATDKEDDINRDWKVTNDAAACISDGHAIAFYYCPMDCSFELICDGDRLRIINQLQLFEYLFANHYDVFGLINKDLAVDINTIEL